MKKFLILSFLFATHVDFVQASEKKSLKEIAQDYVQFVHDVGSARSVQQDDPQISTLFALNLTKIVNGSTLVANDRQLLLPQMKGFETKDNAESQQAAWVVHTDEAKFFPSNETNSVTAHFEWTHKVVGRAAAMAVLQCNDQGQIEHILDVWAKVIK